MDQKKIDRINELSRKSKAEGLTDEEKQEQLFLRREYVDSVVGALPRQSGAHLDRRRARQQAEAHAPGNQGQKGAQNEPSTTQAGAHPA